MKESIRTAPRQRIRWLRAAVYSLLLVGLSDIPLPAAENAKAANEASPAPPRHAVWIKLNGMIDEQRRMYVQRRLEAAIARGADLVILEIDSPGGTLEDSFRLADYVMRLKDIRVVAYVPREAISGAAILALSCHEIVMRENAALGNAGIIEIAVEGRQIVVRAKEKFDSYVQRIREYADARGRPPALAEAMMRHGLRVFHVRHKLKRVETYMTHEELENENADDWEKLNQGKPVFETREGLYLTVTSGQRGVELGLAEAVVRGPEQVNDRYQVRRFDYLQEENWGDTLVFYLHHPLIVGLLFLIGLIAMYVEITSPGVGAGAAVAILCFALYFWSHWAAGTADLLEILLFVLGVAFILFELFVTPGFGVPGILGGLMVLVSLVLASQRVIIPSQAELGEYMATLRDTLATLVVSVVVFFGVAALLNRRIRVGSRLFGRLVLPPPEPEPAVPANPSTEAAGNGGAATPSGLLGKRGLAMTALRPAGRVRIDDELLNVVAAEGEFIDAGRPVEVIEAHGNLIVVREVT
jgi:membrane-bound serine protease (ClpP class)